MTLENVIIRRLGRKEYLLSAFAALLVGIGYADMRRWDNCAGEHLLPFTKETEGIEFDISFSPVRHNRVLIWPGTEVEVPHKAVFAR